MTEPDDPERGAALVVVMAFCALAAMVAVNLMGRYVVEYRQIGDSLAQVRAYWAARGEVSYVLSRTMTSGACGGKAGTSCTGTTDYTVQARTYLAEIKDLQTWSYPDVSYYYNFNLVPTVTVDALAPTGHLGEIEIKTAFGPAPQPAPVPGAAPPPKGGYVLDGLRNFTNTSIRPLDMRYCVVSSQSSGCGGGGGPNTAPVWQRITSVHRPSQ
jgi:Tfp pilus assembly protein PilX